MTTSSDILLIVLAFCCLWFTAFLCWFLYHAAQVLRRVHDLVDEVRLKAHDIEGVILGLRRRIETNVDVMSSIATGVKRILEVLRDRTGRREE